MNLLQVFEAFVTIERNHDDEEDEERYSNSNASKLPSNKLLMIELKQVLTSKAEEHRQREEKAIERQKQKCKIFLMICLSICINDFSIDSDFKS